MATNAYSFVPSEITAGVLHRTFDPAFFNPQQVFSCCPISEQERIFSNSVTQKKVESVVMENASLSAHKSQSVHSFGGLLPSDWNCKLLTVN